MIEPEFDENISRNRVYVFAGDYKQALEWAHRKGIPYHALHHIHNVERIKGIERGQEIYLVGSYGTRRDYYEFAAAACIGGHTLVAG